MGALVSVGRGSVGSLVTPYTAVAAVSARPRRSPVVVATVDLIAIMVAFGAFQIVGGGVSGMRDVPWAAASEPSGGGMTVVAAPPMPRLAGERIAVEGELPTEEILFAEPVALEASFGMVISGPPPDRFALVEPQSASSRDGAGGAPRAASESSNPLGPILSYVPQSSRDGDSEGAVTRTVVATVATVDRSTEAVMEALPAVASGAIDTVVSTGAGIANQAAAAAPLASVAAPVVDSAAPGAAAVAETATSTVNSVVSTTTSAAGGVVSGTTSTVSNVAGAVGGLLN